MFVAGCHRSGTSYVSSLLSSVIDCDRSSDLALTIDNPRGYFESTLLRPFNDNLLSIAGFAWDKPPLASIHWCQGRYLLEVHRNKHDFSAYSLSSNWIDKDPRLSLTFPLFEHLLLKRVPCLVPIRHPFDVSLSLHLRDGFSLEKGLLIWFLYNRSCSLFMQAGVDKLLSYERLLQGDSVQLDRIVEFLRPWADLQCLDDEITNLVSKAHAVTSDMSLRRNSVESCQSRLDLFDTQLASFCSDLYEKISNSGFQLETFSAVFRDCPFWLVDFYDIVFSEGSPSLEFYHLHEVIPKSAGNANRSPDLYSVNPSFSEDLISNFSALKESFGTLADEFMLYLNQKNDDELLIRRIAELEREIQQLKASISWRLTAPLRYFRERLRF